MSVLPSYSPEKAILEPSGEKCGLLSTPGELVRRMARPPSRGTDQMSPAKANATDSLLRVGSRISIGLGPGSNAASSDGLKVKRSVSAHICAQVSKCGR